MRLNRRPLCLTAIVGTAVFAGAVSLCAVFWTDILVSYHQRQMEIAWDRLTHEGLETDAFGNTAYDRHRDALVRLGVFAHAEFRLQHMRAQSERWRSL